MVEQEAVSQLFKLKGAISAFFRVCSSIRRAAHEENTNLAPFNLE